MKSISIKDYNSSMGTLIDIEDAITYNKSHVTGAINIPYQKLIYNFKNYLNPNERYYIYCHGGVKSRRAVSILEIYKYDVTQVLL